MNPAGLPKTNEAFIRKCISEMLNKYIGKDYCLRLRPELQELIKYFLDKLCY